ncbi:helix-turn-helix domain-containing protein [Blastococcus brunescens]|uniref:Helix-turn-helix domain-containing protein n=1 Tax=Blastococcus brunescens TaxID=1564165 RepID=A0ABZ1B792_9ACTN|nr:helix-turn-helix domain-containing protein [Blastococcus sp. BMG 8361]WRL66687.1 helix-turn-helix domain-containing protein [Blastococcus sp. BMG 8361]
MATVTAGLRERKKLATRQALHEAALRLVADHGLDAVSVDDIAERADVSPRTFFNYFASKVDAVVGLDPAAPRRMCDAFAGRPAGESPIESLRAVQRGSPRRWRRSRSCGRSGCRSSTPIPSSSSS